MSLLVKSLFDTPKTKRMTARQYIDHPLSERKSDLIATEWIFPAPGTDRPSVLEIAQAQGIV